MHAGQNVSIIHQKADGSFETIKPSKVVDGEVTFELSSFSPVAVVINATAPKTGEIVMGVAILAMIGLAGVTVFGKKAKLN